MTPEKLKADILKVKAQYEEHNKTDHLNYKAICEQLERVENETILSR